MLLSQRGLSKDLFGQGHAEMFEGSRIDLLKIDIEGAGKEVFQHGMYVD